MAAREGSRKNPTESTGPDRGGWSLILFGIVDDVLKVSGRGIVLSFDFAKSLDPKVSARVGDRIELRTPRGSTLQTEIKAIEHLKPLVRRKPANIGFLLPPNVNLEELEKGMEIWLLRDS